MHEPLSAGAAAQNEGKAVPPTVVERWNDGDDAAWSEPQPLAVRLGAADERRRQPIAMLIDDLEGRARAEPGPATELILGVLKLVRENATRLAQSPLGQLGDMLASTSQQDLRSPEFWRGLGLVLRYQLDEATASLRRRQRGEYATDPYGYDHEAFAAALPFARFLYQSWWRVETHGMQHIPAQGRALLVSNHSGALPFDGMMIVTAVHDQQQRLVRGLFNDWFATIPFVASFLTSLGQVQASPENALRLLCEEQLVCTFPEGYKGTGKLFKDRYKLARFGRAGFVQVALRAQAPIIPVAVVGAEEIYPLLGNIEPLAKAIGAPYFPATPFFPWLGPLGVIPLPSKWSISFGTPIPTSEHGPEAADDPLLVAELSAQTRAAVQAMIDERLEQRRSVFWG